MSLATDFSSLSPGDVIRTDGYSFVVCREVPQQGTQKYDKRYAVALLCDCNHTHAEHVLPYSYAWNARTDAFTAVDGTPLPGWSSDATVERGSYLGTDLSSLVDCLTVEEIPLDWHEASTNDAKDFAMFQRAFNAYKYSDANTMKVASMLQVIGLPATKTQAHAIFTVFKTVFQLAAQGQRNENSSPALNDAFAALIGAMFSQTH